MKELDEIVAHLNEVMEEATAMHDEHANALRAELTEPEPDVEIVGQHLWAAHAAKGRLHWSEIEASLTAMKVLTAEQRTVVEAD